MAAVCGKDCNLGGLSGNVVAHSFTLDIAGQETDVSAFGSGEFGDYLVCRSAGTLSVNTYAYPSEDVGDTVSLSANVGASTLTIPGIVQSKNIAIDAKGIAQFVTTVRITGDIS